MSRASSAPMALAAVSCIGVAGAMVADENVAAVKGEGDDGGGVGRRSVLSRGNEGRVCSGESLATCALIRSCLRRHKHLSWRGGTAREGEGHRGAK